jgi:hypothetical protein
MHIKFYLENVKVRECSAEVRNGGAIPPLPIHLHVVRRLITSARGEHLPLHLEGRDRLKTKTQMRGKFVKWRVWSGFKWLRIDYCEHDNKTRRMY